MSVSINSTYTISDGLLTDTITLTVGQHLTTLTPDMSRTTTFTTPAGQQTFLIVPPGAISQNVSLLCTELDPHQINPPPDGFTFGGRLFEINAYLDAVLSVSYPFPRSITLTLSYRDDLVLDEMGLALFFFDEASSTWTELPLLHRDLAHNRLSFRIDHLTRFALFSPIAQRPTLSLSKGGLDCVPVGTTPSVAVGSILTYTLTLSNISAVDALNVTLSDTLPSGFMFGGWLSQDTASLSANRISWRGLLSSQQGLTLIYTGTVLRTVQTLTNLVQARADETASVGDTAVLWVNPASRPKIFLPLILK